MKKLICVLVLLATSSFAADKLFPSVPKEMLESTHRLLITLTEDEQRDGHTYRTERTFYGSAVAVDMTTFGGDDGHYLLTAAHCVYDKEIRAAKNKEVLVEIRPTDKDKRKYFTQAKVVAFDPDNDIAIIRVEELLKTVKLDQAFDIEAGDAIIAVGCPRGAAPAPSHGFLAAKGVDIQGEVLVKQDNWFQGSAPIYHGNSGGPVFDANKGTVIGIATAIQVDANNVIIQNLGLFVGSPVITDFLKLNKSKISDSMPKKKN